VGCREAALTQRDAHGFEVVLADEIVRAAHSFDNANREG
jgi:hypothetical protein